jgi:isocitrate dehydrogenase (NAD+)
MAAAPDLDVRLSPPTRLDEAASLYSTGFAAARRGGPVCGIRPRSQAVVAYQVTFIPGDGTGPEIADATKRVLDATGVDFEWDVQEAGVDIMETAGTPLPDSVIESIKKNKVAIKGPITTPVGTGFRSVNVALRKAIDLYACVRPCKSYKGVRSRYEDIDLIFIRENTEDLYAGIEFEKDTPEELRIKEEIERLLPGSKINDHAGISIKPISVEGTRRIVQYAFDYAREYGRTKVTAVHKANIMKYTDGLFLEVALEVAEQNSDVEFEERIVDNMCMQLIQKPELYDVLVLPNLYGDILSDLGAGLVGGLGVAPGANIGTHAALFEPTHGSAPKYAGQNKVNPMAMMLSGVMMLRYLKETDAADRMENAIAEVIAEGKDVTYDMKPHRDDPTAVGTSGVADALVEKLQG